MHRKNPLPAIVAAVLTCCIGFELAATAGADGAMVPDAAGPPVPVPPTAALQIDRSTSWVQTALARPLFNGTRRPTPDAAAIEAPAPVLPRVTGIVISPAGKSVIFSGGPAGRSVVASEGSQFGLYSVQSIEAGHVTLRGPEGQRVVGVTSGGRIARSIAGADPDALARLLALAAPPPKRRLAASQAASVPLPSR